MKKPETNFSLLRFLFPWSVNLMINLLIIIYLHACELIELCSNFEHGNVIETSVTAHLSVTVND